MVHCIHKVAWVLTISSLTNSFTLTQVLTLSFFPFYKHTHMLALIKGRANQSTQRKPLTCKQVSHLEIYRCQNRNMILRHPNLIVMMTGVFATATISYRDLIIWKVGWFCANNIFYSLNSFFNIFDSDMSRSPTEREPEDTDSMFASQ